MGDNIVKVLYWTLPYNTDSLTMTWTPNTALYRGSSVLADSHVFTMSKVCFSEPIYFDSLVMAIKYIQKDTICNIGNATKMLNVP